MSARVPGIFSVPHMWCRPVGSSRYFTSSCSNQLLLPVLKYSTDWTVVHSLWQYTDPDTGIEPPTTTLSQRELLQASPPYYSYSYFNYLTIVITPSPFSWKRIPTDPRPLSPNLRERAADGRTICLVQQGCPSLQPSPGERPPQKRRRMDCASEWYGRNNDSICLCCCPVRRDSWGMPGTSLLIRWVIIPIHKACRR